MLRPYFRLIGAGLSALLGAYLFVLVAPKHWRYDSESDLGYLDTYGIGACVWGTLSCMFALAFLVFPSPTDEEGFELLHNIEPPRVPKHDSIDAKDLRSIFGTKTDPIRIATFAFTLAKVAVNIAFIMYNFNTLPPRDPDKRLNQAKHMVTWFEFPMLCILASCTLIFIPSAIVDQSPRYLLVVGRHLQLIGSFSALGSLRHANPIRAMDEILRKKREDGIGVAFVQGILWCVFVPMSILAVMVKIAQVDFVTEVIWWHWDWIDYARLFGFINNLAALAPSQENIKISATCDFIKPNTPLLETEWRKHIVNMLVSSWGLYGFIVYATLTSGDFNKLLNERNRE